MWLSELNRKDIENTYNENAGRGLIGYCVDCVFGLYEYSHPLNQRIEVRTKDQGIV